VTKKNSVDSTNGLDAYDHIAICSLLFVEEHGLWNGLDVTLCPKWKPQLEQVKSVCDTGEVKKIQSFLKTLKTSDPGIAAILQRHEAQVPKSKKGKKHSDLLIDISQELKYLVTPDEKAYAIIETDEEEHVYGVRGKKFRLWLRKECYLRYRVSPGSQAIQDAVEDIEARALFDTNSVCCVRCVCELRVQSSKGAIYYDTGRPDFSAIKVTSDGYETIKKPGVYFRRPGSMLSIPELPEEGDIALLQKHLDVDDETFLLILGFLVQALRPSGPYPVLVLYGEQGSAKSTRSEMLKMLIDPSTALLRSTPRNEDDLFVGCYNNWLLAFDNVSYMPQWLSDAYCKISTGGALAKRTHHTNDEETILVAERPLILNGIVEFVTRGDLGSRCLDVRLPVIRKSKRRPKKEVMADFEKDLPAIIAGLFKAVSVALGNIDSTKLDQLPRMADFAQWATAAEPGFRFFREDDSGNRLKDSERPTKNVNNVYQYVTFLEAYTGNIDEAIETTLENDLVGSGILKLLSEKSSWKGTYAELLESLRDFLPNPEKPPKKFPDTPRGLSDRVKRLMPLLREVGVEKHDSKRSGKGSRLILEQTRKQPTQHAQSTQVSEKSVGSVRRVGNLQGQSSKDHTENEEALLF